MTERTLPPGPPSGQRGPRTVLLRGGAVYSPADPFATAMLVEGEHVAWVGSDGAAEAYADAADEIVELDGALVTPAFVDAHVHATATGLALTGLDLTGLPSLAAALEALAAFAADRPEPGGVLIGHGWDETGWPEGRPPTLAELDAAMRRRRALPLPHRRALRAGHHRAARAHRRLRRPARLLRRRPAHPRRPPRRAPDRARAPHPRAAAGVPSARRWPGPPSSASARCTSAAGPEISSEQDLAALLDLAADGEGPEVFGYWGELGGVETARRLRRGGRRMATSSSTARSARTPPACTAPTPTPTTPAPPT